MNVNTHAINPDTGRMIKIGGGTHKRLLHEGKLPRMIEIATTTAVDVVDEKTIEDSVNMTDEELTVHLRNLLISKLGKKKKKKRRQRTPTPSSSDYTESDSD